MSRFIGPFLFSIGLSLVATALAMWVTPRVVAMRVKQPGEVAADPPGTP